MKKQKPYAFKAGNIDVSKLALTDVEPIKVHVKLVDKNGVEWMTKKIIDGKEVIVPFTAYIMPGPKL